MPSFVYLWGGVNASAQVLGEVKTFKELTNYAPYGNGWRSFFAIDWDTQYLEIQIDGSGCQFNNGNGGIPDNVLSIFGKTLGPREMGTFKVSDCAYVHMYFGSGTIFQYHKGLNYSTGDQLTKTVSNRSNIIIKVTKNEGILLNDVVLFLPKDLTSAFYNSEMTIASEEGQGRMHGTYKSVRLMNLDGTPVVEADITSTFPSLGTVFKELVPEGKTFPFQATGKFEVETDIDWNTQKIVAQVDLNGITRETDFFAMTTGDGDFTTFNGTTTAPNMHMYTKPGQTTFSAFFAYPGSNSNSEPITTPSDNIYNIDLSKAHGTVINGAAVKNHAPTTLQWQALTAATTVKVGTGEKDKDSGATYNYIRLVSTDYIVGSTTTGNTLDEAAVNTFAGQNNVMVALKRKFVADQWNTICLPFDVDAATMRRQFGTYELCTLDNVQNNVMNFNAIDGGAITAGHPYMLKPSKDVTDPTFNKVDIVAGEPTQVSVGTGWGMQGTYGLTTLEIDGSNLFIVSGGKFMKPETAEKAVMKGMRAYFIVPSGTNAKMLRANLDGVETSIDAIGTDDAVIVDTTVYTIQGQRLGNTLEGLPRGLYIQNGKKVLVK